MCVCLKRKALKTKNEESKSCLPACSEKLMHLLGLMICIELLIYSFLLH